MVDLTQNYFELFELPVSCQPDQQLLARQYRALQRTVHPDRFAADSERQQRLSVQYAAFVNEAFHTLKQPLARAVYLLRLAGREVDMERNTVMDAQFLMAQMELRDEVSELKAQANPEADLERLIKLVDDDNTAYFNQFEQHWQAQELEQAETIVRKMQFMVKLAAELAQLESKLLDDQPLNDE